VTVGIIDLMPAVAEVIAWGLATIASVKEAMCSVRGSRCDRWHDDRNRRREDGDG
jgi:hypothetical protein